MVQGTTLEDVARRAVDGDREALDTLVQALQGDIYGLALRMLWNREDAEDATQEILVRVVTRLSQFDFRSKLKTWVYRVAVNYILDVKKSPVERMHLSFDWFAEDLAEGLSADGPMDAERSLLTEEVKIGCTLGMLQCLDRPHRLAYVLGEILDMPGPEAAEVLEVTSDVFRKRLQRARAAIISLYTRLLRAGIRRRGMRLQPSRTGGPACRKNPRRFLRLCRKRFVLSGGSRDHSAGRGGEMGGMRSTEPAILVTRRSTSRVVWPEHSTLRMTDVSVVLAALSGWRAELEGFSNKTSSEPWPPM